MHEEAIEDVLSDYQVNTKQKGTGYQQWHSVRHTDYSYFLLLRDEIAGTGVTSTQGYRYRKQMFDEYLKKQGW